MTEADERALAAFLAPAESAPKERTLADVIAAKLKEAEAAAAAGKTEGEGAMGAGHELNEKVVEVYKG